MTSTRHFYVRVAWGKKTFSFKPLIKTRVNLIDHFIWLSKAKDAGGRFPAQSLIINNSRSTRGLLWALHRLPLIIADPSVPFRSPRPPRPQPLPRTSLIWVGVRAAHGADPRRNRHPHGDSACGRFWVDSLALPLWRACSTFSFPPKTLPSNPMGI